MQKKHTTLFLFLIIAIGLILVISFNANKAFITQKDILKPRAIVIEGQTINIEVVDRGDSRLKGLSGREILEDDTGMLFVFDESAQHGIWMKDMRFAIDIVWISQNFQVVAIAERISPDTYPQVFTPEIPARYVLELSSGKVDSIDFSVGDTITFIP